MKYKAPALAQGITVLDTLLVNGSMSLDEIARNTDISKATLLRLLETLVSHSWVKKDLGTKRYEVLVEIKPKNMNSYELNALIQDALDELSKKSGCTTEWYILHPEYAQIELRSEPVDAVVNVSARVGFTRRYDKELEAVTRIAHAGKKVSVKNNAFWTYVDGCKRELSKSQVDALLNEVGEDLLVLDNYWNTNGVRRYAAGISLEGKLLGIVSLAESFTPQADTLIDEKKILLRNAQNRISNIFKIHGEINE